MPISNSEKQRRHRQSQKSKLDQIYDQNVNAGRKLNKINKAIDAMFDAKKQEKQNESVPKKRK